MTDSLSRRRLLHSLGVALAAYPIARLASGCGDNADSLDATDGVCSAATEWASGGTAAMTGKACYPDPFAAGVTACALLVCETTEGPCTAPTTARQDVSDGMPGLPVRLALKLVTAETCEPIADAVVEIWHTQKAGVYSGTTPNPQLCSGGDAEAPSLGYFRGTQISDANGRIDFDTCFPGWYRGRAIHIHVRISVGATTFVVSQLFFADTLITEIFDDHPDYADYGQPDTANSDDNIIGSASAFTAYVLDTARMSDGAMLASKVIAVRGAGQANC
ncbi:MAG: protocatechuate 3,4-dioxygenase [Kofleriaceae bacterium]